MFKKGDLIKLKAKYETFTHDHAKYAMEQLSDRDTEVFEVSIGQTNDQWVLIKATQGAEINNSYYPKQFRKTGTSEQKAEAMPTEAERRKMFPVATGVMDYFPDAIMLIAECSKIGNDQHNPDKPLHWDRSKSGDESDALMRHFIERGTKDVDGIRHSAKVAWRALALLQKEFEADGVT